MTTPNLFDLENPIHRAKAAFKAVRVMTERYAEDGDSQNGVEPNELFHTLSEAQDRIAEVLDIWNAVLRAGRKAA